MLENVGSILKKCLKGIADCWFFYNPLYKIFFENLLLQIKEYKATYYNCPTWNTKIAKMKEITHGY